MKKKEALFFLIKSLTKSELRYFKLFCGAENANYIRLFEVIHKQQTYDEKEVKEVFKEEPFIRQLTATKYYLKNLLLKSLRNYHSQISKDAEIKDLLRNIEILYNKGLLELCRTEFRRAWKLAEQTENFPALYQLTTWERKLVTAAKPQKNPLLKEMVDRQLSFARQLVEDSVDWQKMLSPHLFDYAPIEEEIPLRSYGMRWLFQYQKRFMAGEREIARDCLLKIIDRFEQHPIRLREDPHLYLNVLNNMLAFLIFEKEMDEATALARKVRNFLSQHTQLSAPLLKVLFRTLNIELEIYRDTRDFAKAELLIGEIQTLDRDVGNRIPLNYQLSFWFQFAHLYFLQRKYDDAIGWINAILNHPERQTRSDLVTHTQWLNLMLHFEMRNFFVLGYFVDGFRRYLKKRKKIQPYEQKILSFFSRSIQLPEAELSPAFRRLHATLTSDQRYSISSFERGYLDLIGWIATKANNPA